MLKTLLKKQFIELNTFYFQNKKTGKNRSTAGIIGMVALFFFVFASIGFAFFGMDTLFCSSFLPLGMDWMYFALTGSLAIFLGVFGGVFNTYAGLYHAKDNELLLSMPIPPSKILFSRMVGVYAMGLLYEALVIVPAVLVYWLNTKITFAKIIVPLLLIFILGFLVLSLICALGWVVALVSSKLKNKSAITVILTVTFLGVYYFVSFRLNQILQYVAANAQEIGNKVKDVYPLYFFGLAWTGKFFQFIVVTAIVVALTALVYFVMSKTFLKIVTTKAAEKKTEYKAQVVKNTSVSQALLHKEIKRFASSPTYIMNCGMGVVIMPILAIIAFIKYSWISEAVALIFEQAPQLKGLLPLVVSIVLCLILSMNQFTAPSISLEGKNLWILQSSPIETIKIFDAKQKLHYLFNIPSTVFSSVLLGLAFKFDFTQIVLMTVLTVAFVMFTSATGLYLNLKKPNLTWTNEVVPLKQGASMVIALFGGWFFCFALGAIGYFAAKLINPTYYMVALIVLLTLVTRIVNGWLKKKGTVIFQNL